MPELEIRAAKTVVKLQGRELTGLAAPYSTPTQIRSASGDFTEILDPGCFRSILDKDPDVTCNVNHSDAQILGRTSNGTLKLGEDHRGLNFQVTLTDDPYSEHIYNSVKRGDLAGCSFAFRVGPQDQVWSDGKGGAVRHITSIADLQDVAVVARPAYNGTTIDARSVNQASAETRSMLDKFLQKRVANQKEVFRMTADFVREQLHVSLFWDSNMNARSMDDQMKLMRMACDFQEMRSKGYSVELIHDEKRWPRIVYAGPTSAVKRLRRRIVFDLPLYD
jgi:HK97 family phage prohead protease